MDSVYLGFCGGQSIGPLYYPNVMSIPEVAGNEKSPFDGGAPSYYHHDKILPRCLELVRYSKEQGKNCEVNCASTWIIKWKTTRGSRSRGKLNLEYMHAQIEGS